MQRIIFTFGAISGAVCFAVFVTGATMAINSNSAEASGVLGYLIMLVALSVIFVGIKRYRDRELGEVHVEETSPSRDRNASGQPQSAAEKPRRPSGR